ncbi:MAG: hypothetical protein ACTSSI_06800 [Candidatus Helarchaeota archaeon]
MIDDILKILERSTLVTTIRAFNDLLFYPAPATRVKKTSHDALRTINLEMIRGIGPKTREKLEQHGIHDSSTKLKAWKTAAARLEMP